MAIQAKTVLITGASRGIGRAAAIAFGRQGYNVAVNYCTSVADAETAAALIVSAGGNARIYKADVSDRTQVDSMVQSVVRDFGGIDVLVNNAGIAEIKMFCDITERSYDRMFDINVKGVFNCTQSALKGMIAKKSGRIINISSVWGIDGGACEVHYSASKAAVIGMTKALAKELGLSGINVNCVAPGAIDTDMNDDLSASDWADIENRTALGRRGTVTDVAESILFLAGSGGDFITGQVIVVDGLFR